MMRSVIAAVLIGLVTPGFAAEANITDGDTLLLDGVTFRLDGIEAPQTDQTCLDDRGERWECGIAARDSLRQHVGKRDVRCEDRGADSAWRTRRTGVCFVVGETTSLNQWMVREGWAMNTDRSAKGPFTADRDNASANRKGLWKGCFISPERLQRFTVSTTNLLGSGCPSGNNLAVRQKLFPEFPAQPTGCTIKGRNNLRSQAAGYRGIYHLESCRSYARTRAPHRWFCSEDEAKAEGFRKSYTC